MQEARYDVDQLRALAVEAVAEISGATLDSFALLIAPPNRAQLEIRYSLPAGHPSVPRGFKSSTTIIL